MSAKVHGINSPPDSQKVPTADAISKVKSPTESIAASHRERDQMASGKLTAHGSQYSGSALCRTVGEGGVAQFQTDISAAASNDSEVSKLSQSSKETSLTEKEKSTLEHYPTLGGRGIYVCKACGQVFVSMSRFRQHLSSHMQDSKVECRHCGKSFDNHEALAKHAASHTATRSPSEQPEREMNEADFEKEPATGNAGRNGADVDKVMGNHTCPACNKSFSSSSDLNRHTLSHKNITFFQCATCEQLFVTRVAFSYHLQSNCIPPRVEDLNCEICEKKFASVSEVSQHRCHQYKTVEGTLHKPAQKNAGKFLCDDCGIIFRAERPYITHLIKHTMNKAKGLEQNDLECQKCKVMFTSKRTLSKHMRIHEPDSYPCQKCDAVFSSKRALVSHQKKHITEPDSSTFSCQFCDLSFLNRQELNMHIRTDHANLKPFACDQCDSSFKAKFDLLRHKLKHEGKKFYSCQYCGREFYARENLKHHEAAVHSSSPRAKPFMCHECGKTFFTRGHLNTHRRSHSTEQPFACPECPVRCKTKKNLDVHMRRHRGELPIKCRICGVGFVDHCYLTRHMAHHKPAPDLHCHLCHKAFYQQQHLKAHISTIHFICFDCNETFADKREVKLHRRDCPLPGSAGYLKRPGVMPTLSAVVVEPVNPGGNMLAMTPVEGSSNFADTLAPTTGPDVRDVALSQQNTEQELPAREEATDLTPFGHYNADTNTVIIYEDQLRWVKNAMNPSGSGPCTYEINIPGENQGEMTKLIIEDKTGDICNDHTVGELCVPEVSQVEEVTLTATEKIRVKPHKLKSRESCEVRKKPVATEPATSQSVMTVSLADGLEKAVEQAQLKDLRVSLVDVRHTLLKIASNLLSDEPESTSFGTSSTSLFKPGEEIKNQEQIEDKVASSVIMMSEEESAASEDLFVSTEGAGQSGTVCMATNKSQVSSATTDAFSTDLDGICDKKVVDTGAGAATQSQENSKREKSDQMAAAKHLGARTLFLCRQCEKMFATRAGALTHTCPAAAKDTSSMSGLSVSSVGLPFSSLAGLSKAVVSDASNLASPTAEKESETARHAGSSFSSDSSTPKTSAPKNIVSGPKVMSVNCDALVSKLTKNPSSMLLPDDSALTSSTNTSSGGTLSTGTTVEAAGQLSSQTKQKPSAETLSSGVVAKSLPGTSPSSGKTMSLVGTSLTAVTTESLPGKLSGPGKIISLPTHGQTDGKSAESLSNTEIKDPIQMPSQKNVSSGKTKTVSLLSDALTSNLGNIIKLAPELSGANKTSQAAGKAPKQSSSLPGSSSVVQPPKPATKLVQQSGSTPGSLFKCYFCGALYPTFEAVIAHTRMHSSVPAARSTGRTATVSSATTQTAKPVFSFGMSPQSSSVIAVSSSSSTFGSISSVFISVPAPNTSDKTRVIALPGKLREIAKPSLAPYTVDIAEDSGTSSQDTSCYTEASKKPGVPGKAFQHPSKTPSAHFSGLTSIQAASHALSPEIPDSVVNHIPDQGHISDSRLSTPSVSITSEQRGKDGEKQTPALIAATLAKEQTKITSPGDVHSMVTASCSKESADSDILFECNGCGHCFSTVAAFAAHARESHPKSKPKRQRPGRRRSTWRKHKQQWDEKEKATAGDQASKHTAAGHTPTSDTPTKVTSQNAKKNTAPRDTSAVMTLKKRKLPARSAKKSRIPAPGAKTTEAQTLSPGKRQGDEVKKQEQKAGALERGAADATNASDAKRARMSVLELAAAAEVVEDRMWQLDRPYQCDVCNASFSQLQQVQDHLTSVHQRQEVYRCSHCVGVFSSLPALTLHFQKHAQLTAKIHPSADTSQAEAIPAVTPPEKKRESAPRRRARSTSSSARGRRSSLTEHGKEADSPPADKGRGRNTGGLTLESLADAAVALVERREKLSVSTQPAPAVAPTKSMWEACYTIGDETFTISVAVPAPVKPSTPYTSVELKDQTDPRQDDALSTLSKTARATESVRQLDFQKTSVLKNTSQTKDTAPRGLADDEDKTSVTAFATLSQTLVKDHHVSRAITRSRRSLSVSVVHDDEASSLQQEKGLSVMGPQDKPPVNDSTDSDISIHSGDEEDEDLPVLSLPFRTKPHDKVEHKTARKTSKTAQKTRGTKKRSIVCRGPQPAKSKCLSTMTPSKYEISSSMSSPITARKSIQSERKVMGNNTAVRKVELKSAAALGEDSVDADDIGQTQVYKNTGEAQELSPKRIESSFRCEVCHETFSAKASLDEHVVSHVSVEGTYSCPSCWREFRSYPHLVTHLLQHVAGLSFRCGLCTAAFNHYAALHAHHRTHNQPRKAIEDHLLCPICGRLFTSKAILVRHQQRHCPRSKQQSQVFHKEALLGQKAHTVLKRKTVEKTIRKVAIQLQPQSRDYETEEENYIDSLTTEEAGDTGVLDNSDNEILDDGIAVEGNFQDQEICDEDIHAYESSAGTDKGDNKEEDMESIFVNGRIQSDGRDIHGPHLLEEFPTENFDSDSKDMQSCPESPDLEDKQFATEHEKQSHRAVPKQKPLCPVCKRSFCNKRYLTIHMRSHAVDDDQPAGRLVCPECGKTFAHEASLHTHRKCHQAGSRFKCSTCDKVYRHKHTLQQHEKTHEGKTSRRYTCPICSQSFSNHHDMVYHQEGHDTNQTRPKPFLCSTCGKAFSRLSYLNMHAKRHVGPQFPCLSCNKVLTSKRALEEHRWSHSDKTPYKCEICDAIHKSKAALERHKCRHSGSFPFLCQSCGKGFTRKESLREHEVNHLDENSQGYICDMCGKVLQNRAGFVTHMRFHKLSMGSDSADSSQILTKTQSSTSHGCFVQRYSSQSGY